MSQDDDKRIVREFLEYRAFVGVARARLRDATLHATANGKTVQLPGMGVVKMIESHDGWDALALLAQLGEAPKSLEDVLR